MCIGAKNTLIKGIEGVSNGLVPILKEYNMSIATMLFPKITKAKNQLLYI